MEIEFTMFMEPDAMLWFGVGMGLTMTAIMIIKIVKSILAKNKKQTRRKK